MPEREEDQRQSDTSETGNTQIGQCCAEVKGKGRRKDAGRLHAVRHAVLSRYPLEALRHLGEDPKALRRLERKFRAALKPRGAIADIVFDRFFASYLRCLLAARTEASLFLRRDEDRGKELAAPPRLVDGDVPTLVVDQTVEPESPPTLESVEQGLLGELALVQRYDRHFSTQMYQAMALLLILRSSGEVGLEESLVKSYGIRG